MDDQNESKDKAIRYCNYLQLEKLLGAQAMQSEIVGNAVHDEHLFIITHQVYELWFKQIIYEIDSVQESLQMNFLDERMMFTLVNRLNRVTVIFKLMVDQMMVLETMTPLDFLEFRGYLAPASGFQSLQFRLLENKLGIIDANRVKYNQQNYKEVFTGHESERVNASANKPSLVDAVNTWLERTPGINNKDNFKFWEKYRQATRNWLKDLYPTDDDNMSEEDKERQRAEYKKHKDVFKAIFDEATYQAQLDAGVRRISYQAFKGALMISLYRDEPRFHQPYQLVTLLMDIDSLLTKWRYNHVMLVQRMIGSKIGTGGSSGYQYLRSTISDRYKVFLDLFNISTYLIPRDYIPQLNKSMRRRLSVFSMQKAAETSTVMEDDVMDFLANNKFARELADTLPEDDDTTECNGCDETQNEDSVNED